VVFVFLALHAAIGWQLIGWHGHPLPADPHTLWLGLGFLLWGAALLATRRFENRSILFQIMEGARGTRLIGYAFTMLAAFLLGRYIGVF
jgi:hypothetical protein